MKKLNYYFRGRPSKEPLENQMRVYPLNLYKKDKLKELIQNKNRTKEVERE